MKIDVKAYKIHMCNQLRLDLENSYIKYKHKCTRNNSLSDFIRLILKNTYRHLETKNKIITDAFKKISLDKTTLEKSLQYSKEREFLEKMCKYSLLLDSYRKYDFEEKELFAFRTTNEDTSLFLDMVKEFNNVDDNTFLTSLLCYFLTSDFDVQHAILNVNNYEIICSSIENKNLIKITTKHNVEYVLPYKLDKKGRKGTELIGVVRRRKKNPLIIVRLNDIISVEEYKLNHFEFTKEELYELNDRYNFRHRFETFKVKINPKHYGEKRIYDSCIVCNVDGDIYTIKTTRYNLNYLLIGTIEEVLEPKIDNKESKNESISMFMK